MMKNLTKLEEGDPKYYGALEGDHDATQDTSPLNGARQGVIDGARKRIIFALSLCTLLLIAEIVGKCTLTKCSSYKRMGPVYKGGGGGGTHSFQ